MSMGPEDFRQIIWLASYPKSGNTWVRLLMDAYFYGGAEINDVMSSVGDSDADYYQLDSLTPLRYPLHIQQLIRPSALVKRVLQYQQRKFSGVPMFMKTHHVNTDINGIELLPKSLTKSVIYIARDPRDVVPSFADHMGIMNDEAIDRMAGDFAVLSSENNMTMEFTSSWLKHVKSYIAASSKSVGVFRYEDLKADTVETFSKMLAHVGIEADEQRVKNAVKLCELAKLQKQESEQGFVEKSPKGGDFFGGKRKPLKVSERKKIEAVFGREMQQLGYL